ncbi:Glucose-6-phosphate exchanger SLC37A2, partial [Eschrichtius robustus]|nr:Glucose-6-phosphate exchanger SLC37A2 [Eschrichtius robustus]
MPATEFHFSAKESGDLSTLFDVGGIVGGILAGLISDYTNGRATTCCVMLILAAPMMFLYNYVGQSGISISIVMLLICGALVNGPYALITTAVSADLGTHKSLKGNAKALSTVTAIIDGTGSIGAALGPLLAGLISPTGWNNVFYMLITADILACLLLCRLVYKEILAWKASLSRDRGKLLLMRSCRSDGPGLDGKCEEEPTGVMVTSTVSGGELPFEDGVVRVQGEKNAGQEALAESVPCPALEGER